MKSKLQNINTVDELRFKVINAKSELRSFGIKNYMTIFLDAYPKYNNHKRITEVNGVFQLRRTDDKITKDILAFVSKLKKQLS